MAITEESDQEIAAYLQFLLDHQSECHSGACPFCSTLETICHLASSQLFSIEYFWPPNYCRSVGASRG